MIYLSLSGKSALTSKRWGGAKKESADFRHTLSRLTTSPLHPMRKSTPYMGHVPNDGVLFAQVYIRGGDSIAIEQNSNVSALL